MKFQAIRTGHTRNAKALLLKTGDYTAAQLEMMNGNEIDALISEQYVAVVLQEDAGDYDEIYLIPISDWNSVLCVNR